jgi:arylsulfatase A-like enzyme
MKALEEEKLLDRTLVVFFSDNGGVNWQAMKREGRGGPGDLAAPLAEVPPTSNAPLRGGKASVYEGGVREPCLVVWPGVARAGARSDAMIQSIDFLPTLAEAAGAALPGELKLDGRSFAAVLRGESKTHRNEVFTFFPHNTPASGQRPACAVRRGDWKLIRYFHDGPKQEHRHELYHLRDDLGETKDLAAAEPALVRELDALIEGFLKDTAAVVPGPNPAYGGESQPAAAADPLQGWKARGSIFRPGNSPWKWTGSS